MVPLSGDQSSVPRQDGVRTEDRANISENSTAEQLPLRRQSSSLVVGQEEALLAQILPQDSILKVVDDGLLVPVDPSGCGDHEQLPGA